MTILPAKSTLNIIFDLKESSYFKFGSLVFNPSNGEMFEAQNLSDWDNVSTLKCYQILLADTQATEQTCCPFMLQKSINSCVQSTAQPARERTSSSNEEQGQMFTPAMLLQKGRS